MRSALFSLIFFFFSSLLVGTPIKTATSLPLTGNDIKAIREKLNNDESPEEFVYFIKGIDVFPDHKNARKIHQLEDRNIEKIFYVAPYFQASEERSVVGSQEIAEEGVKIINALYELTEAFDLDLYKLNQIRSEKSRKIIALGRLRKNIAKLTEDLPIQLTKKLILDTENEISRLAVQEEEIENKANKGIEETSIGLKKQVVSQIQLKLSFLGIVANPTESSQLKSSSAASLREGIASLIARATGEGQFGYRAATFEAGFTKEQRKWISLYRSIRPDIKIVSLPAKKVYARGTALSSKEDKNSVAKSYFLGNSQLISKPRIFLAINGGSQGACGNTRACNVIIEYTWVGARMAQTSQSGALTMPIYFEGDVDIMQPDFEGVVSCDFVNGFRSSGRSDVIDGAVIYDGDVYNQINHEALEEGACSYNITKGDEDSAAYHTVKYIYEQYMILKMQRASKSRAEKDLYKKHVDNELSYHAANSQVKDYDSWSFTSWSDLGDPWVIVANEVIDEARSFYWHTRTEDSSVSESVKFSTTISTSNIQKLERIAFDGFPILCWKKDVSGIVLAGCPSKNLSEYIKNSDTDLGKNMSLCGEEALSTECLNSIEGIENDTDENGVLEDL